MGRMITRHDDICTEIFKQIFPRSFKNVVPVQDFSEVTKYLLQWDKASQQLEVLEALFELDGVRRTMKTGFLGLFGERVDSITYYQNRVEDLSVKIKRARRKAQSSRAARSSFVLFDNQVDAAEDKQGAVSEKSSYASSYCDHHALPSWFLLSCNGSFRCCPVSGGK